MKSYLFDVSSLLDNPGSHSEVDAELEVDELVLRTQSAVLPEKPSLRGVVEGVGSAVMLRAELSALIEQQCSRCLEPFVNEVVVPVEELYRGKPGVRAPAVNEESEAFPIVGGKIDLVPAAVQALLMEVPFKPLCAPDCGGLCPVCGKNLNLEPHRCKIEAIDDRMSGLRGLSQALEEERERKRFS